MPPREKAIFRILTEDVPGYHNAVIDALHRHGFPYSTTMSGVGYGPDQNDKPENSLAIDVVVDYDPETEKRMMDAVNEIRQDNGPDGQGSVLLLCIPDAVFQRGRQSRTYEWDLPHLGGGGDMADVSRRFH